MVNMDDKLALTCITSAIREGSERSLARAFSSRIQKVWTSRQPIGSITPLDMSEWVGAQWLSGRVLDSRPRDQLLINKSRVGFILKFQLWAVLENNMSVHVSFYSVIFLQCSHFQCSNQQLLVIEGYKRNILEGPMCPWT